MVSGIGLSDPKGEIRNLRKDINDRSHGTFTEDLSSCFLEEGHFKTSGIALVMGRPLPSFLHAHFWVIEPFRPTSESTIHDDSNDHAKWISWTPCVEHNGNDAPNLKRSAFMFFHIVRCMPTCRRVGWSHYKLGASFIQEGIITKFFISPLKLHIHFLGLEMDRSSHGA